MTCPSCLSDQTRLIGPIPPAHTFAGRPLKELLPASGLHECLACRCFFRWPRVAKERLDELYQLADFEIWEYDPRRRADWVAAADYLRDELPGGALLDVGCFDGAFLRFVRSTTPGWTLCGLELNEDAARLAEADGFEIVGKDATDLLPGQTYDAVAAFDVIEHLSSPRAFLESLIQATRPGGAVIISTGNTDALSWRLMGSRYWYCTLAEHLSFVSPDWFYREAQRLGVKVERVIRFSHASERGAVSRTSETLKNLSYRLAPRLFRFLRRRGMGGVDLSSNPDLADSPPIWLTAEDQFVVVLRRAR